MGDGAAVLPLRLGFVEKSEKQPTEIEGGGYRSAETHDLARGKKRPPSPPTPGAELDSPTSTLRDEGDDWLLSDSSSEEDEDDQDTHRPFTVVDFPRVSCDHDNQTDLLYENPETMLRGPPAIRLFPPFKTGKHAFGRGYNLADKSEISVRDLGECSNECCCLPMDLLQFVSIKIAGYEHNHSGPAKISGFVAARDTIEPLRNYVYRHDIDNCEAVTVKSKTGVARLSLISPARVISFSSRVLIEFELHAQSDETYGINGPIIEGCTELYNMTATKSFIEHYRLYGERCALDIKYLVLINAVEAQVDVKVLHLGANPGGINMKLFAKTSDFKEVICLFQGAAPDMGEAMSFIIAAEWRKSFDLYIEGSAMDGPSLGMEPRMWQRSFDAGCHHMNETTAKVGEFATFSVKVTWRTHTKKALRKAS